MAAEVPQELRAKIEARIYLRLVDGALSLRVAALDVMHEMVEEARALGWPRSTVGMIPVAVAVVVSNACADAAAVLA